MASFRITIHDGAEMEALTRAYKEYYSSIGCLTGMTMAGYLRRIVLAATQRYKSFSPGEAEWPRITARLEELRQDIDRWDADGQK